MTNFESLAVLVWNWLEIGIDGLLLSERHPMIPPKPIKQHALLEIRPQDYGVAEQLRGEHCQEEDLIVILLRLVYFPILDHTRPRIDSHERGLIEGEHVLKQLPELPVN